MPREDSRQNVTREREPLLSEPPAAKRRSIIESTLARCIAASAPMGSSAPWRAATERRRGGPWGALLRPRDAGPAQCTAIVALICVAIGLAVHHNAYFNWSYAICDALLALAVSMSLSWAGLPAFGMGLFYAVGGYWAAIVGNHLGAPTIVLLLGGAVGAMLVAFVLSLFTVSLSFHSFAMLSLITSQAGYQLIFTFDFLGKENGLFGVQRGSIFGIQLGGDAAFYWYCVVILLILVFATRMFYQSTSGRALRASRDDAVKAESLGVNVRRLRIISFSLGGFVAGTSGVLYAQLQGVVDPSMVSWTMSASAVMMVVLGGLGTYSGALVGGVLFRWVTLLIINASTEPNLWIGLVFVILVIASPGGAVSLVSNSYRLARRLIADAPPTWWRRSKASSETA